MGYKWFCLALAAALPLSAQMFKLTKEQLVEVTRKNPYDRFPDGRPKVPNDVLEKVRGLSVEEVWGPIRGEAGYPNQYEGDWQIMHPGKKLVGRVVTAQFMPLRTDLNELLIGELKSKFNFSSSPHQWVIDQLQEGDVFVVDLFGKEEGGSIVGDNLAMAVKSATKWGGIVVDGAIRDLWDVRRMGLTVYARSKSPRTAVGHYATVAKNVPVECAGVTVRPGDIIVADEDGVVVVPQEHAARVLKEAQTIDDRERGMYPFIREFKSLQKAIAKFNRI
jgi:regulator of RNase E activity RraA